MSVRLIPCLAVTAFLFTGCHPSDSPSVNPPTTSPQNEAAAANQLFLNQKTFDPWVLTSNDAKITIPFYKSNGDFSLLFAADGTVTQTFQAGKYVAGQLVSEEPNSKGVQGSNGQHTQTLNLRDGTFTTNPDVFLGEIYPKKMRPVTDWPHIWQTSDIIIQGDPEAQQVTHANMFYLMSSTYPGSDHSIPPMGLSSNIYGGHIFWDAEIWMMPALIAQHPDYAKSIIDYRFKTLGQAKKNAQAHGFKGAEYAWESADTGAEMAPAEFAKERHITADVGWAAWQYFLWTGDKAYLKKEGWPILQATADYWLSRVHRDPNTGYHIKGVLGPDETAGLVDDDAWTNGVVAELFRAAAEAQKIVGIWPSNAEAWSEVAVDMYLPFDPKRGIVGENDTPITDRFAAKQADTLLLYYPLQHVALDPKLADPTLDFYIAHTIKNGPAMTASIESIVAARRLRAQQSLDLFHDSYRPFVRGPWDAFAEKRTSNRVYFCTGMGGCLQSVLYGFAGLNLEARGTQIAGSLAADPHLPPGWTGITVKGVQYHGKSYDIAVTQGNKVTVTPR